jgi:Tol biopolymer transport system component
VATLATPTAGLWTVPLSDTVQTEQAVTRVRAPNSRAGGPRFGPGYLAFLSSKGGGNGLWKRENDLDQELWRGDGGGVLAPPAISPDGRLICFSYRRQGTTRVYVMNANGTNVRPLVDSLDVRGPASWSADGKWVVVAANEGEGTRLFRIPVDGGQPVRLLDALAEQPVWSPDGRFILYTELLAAGSNEIKATTPDGVPVPIPFRRLGAGILTSYRFLPDGKAIIALEGALGSSQNFFRIDLQSGEQRRLTDLPGRFTIQHFDVSPDGKHIVFDRVQLNADIVVMNLAR